MGCSLLCDIWHTYGFEFELSLTIYDAGTASHLREADLEVIANIAHHQYSGWSQCSQAEVHVMELLHSLSNLNHKLNFVIKTYFFFCIPIQTTKNINKQVLYAYLVY